MLKRKVCELCNGEGVVQTEPLIPYVCHGCDGSGHAPDPWRVWWVAFWIVLNLAPLVYVIAQWRS